MRGFMNYADEFGLGAMIHIPSFIKTVPGIQKLLGGVIHTDTDRNVAL
jgi:hypothetical protein